MITVIGLGTEKDGLTLRALKAIKSADKVLVRNACAPLETLDEENIAYEVLEGVYRKSRSFDTLTKNLIGEVRRRAKGIDLCYCVEGALTEDRAAQALIAGGAIAVEGVGKSARRAVQAGFSSYTAVSAYEVGERELTLPLIVYDLDDKMLAGDVKLTLTECFGDDAQAIYFYGDGAKTIALCEADRQEGYDASSALALSDVPLLKKQRFDLYDFVEILKRLRAPDGCPWDRAQTHQSIRINLIEEAYELADALDADDQDKILEEAGDVLMQSLFHTLIEEERGRFTVTDMISAVCHKLITRHTHVFGADRAESADGALNVWDKNKMTEKGQATYSDAVNDVPECFPALLRAQKICKRVAKGGWGIGDFGAVCDKINEELKELKGASEGGNREEIDGELGDVLMAVAELARVVGADAEQSLLDSVKKVQRRFNAYEKLVLADGRDMNALTREEREAYYQRAKQ